MPDPDESRRFEDIVARLGLDDPGFATPARARSRRLFLVGLALCLTAAALIAFGGVEGAVIAVIPWILGLVLVVRSRGGDAS